MDHAARPAPETPAGERQPRSSRIHRGRDVRALLGRGVRYRTSHLDVLYAASPTSRPRAGVLVPLHRRPVTSRNLLKRRLREVVRRDILPALWAKPRSLDVLVRARPEAYRASFRELRAELRKAVEGL